MMRGEFQTVAHAGVALQLESAPDGFKVIADSFGQNLFSEHGMIPTEAIGLGAASGGGLPAGFDAFGGMQYGGMGFGVPRGAGGSSFA
jgi:hypothetical protein